MNELVTKGLKVGGAMIGGAFALVVVDIRAFYVARKVDKSAQFDWQIFWASAGLGAIMGAMPGLAFTMGD